MSALLSIGSSLFGWMTNTKSSRTAAGEALSKGMEMFDQRTFTEEERAENQKQLVDQYIRQMEIVNTQSTPTAVTRRYIAWSLIGVVIYLILKLF